MGAAPPIRVTAVSFHRRRIALSLLYGHVARRDRSKRVTEVLHAAEYGEVDLDGLLVAEIAGQPVGAGLIIPQRDGTVFVWPPVVDADAAARHSVLPGDVSDAILQDVSRKIDVLEATIGQCLIECDRTRERDELSRNGFRHFADLEFLQRTLLDPLPQRGATVLESIEFDPTVNRDQFARILEATYVGTLDCPELNSMRNGAQALRSHELAGEFEPSRWMIYRSGGKDVGVLLLSEHPDQKAWEIVYMGVVPESRGQGLGRAIVLEGLHQAQAAGIDSVILAVDCRNAPARRIYAEFGFIAVARRAVHARICRPEHITRFVDAPGPVPGV